MVLQDDLIGEIEQLRGRDTVPAEHVLLALDLCRCHRKAKAELRQDKAIECLSLLRVRPEADGLSPALDLQMFRCGEQALDSLCVDLCEVLVKHNRWEPGQVEALQHALRGSRPDLSRLIREAVRNKRDFFESLSETVPIAWDGLLFLGFQTGKPLFEMIAQEVAREEGRSSWSRAICPICGHEPDMAKLEKELGKRILHCPLCDSEWVFRRLQCPFCLNDNQDTLRFFFTDQESPYRVDICDECGRYVKTVDERKLAEGQEVCFALEDIATIYLDVAAWEEGFLEPNLHFPGLRDETVL